MTHQNSIFIRDMKIPVSISQEPYFCYLLKLIDPYYNSMAKYEVFQKAVALEGFEAFMMKNKTLRNDTLDYLTSKSSYLQFNEMDMSHFVKQIPIQKRDLYIEENAGNRFISVDLTKANFQAFNFVSPDFFDGYNTYEDFMKSRGADEYFLMSKMIRQVIFGNMNPQRQQKVQLFIMNTIAAQLQAHGVDMATVYSLSSDELVFEAQHHTEASITEALKDLPHFKMRVEEFFLERPFVQPFYIKRFMNGKMDFKLVPTDSMAEFIKRLEGREIEEMDLYFYDASNKRLAKYLEPHIEEKG